METVTRAWALEGEDRCLVYIPDEELVAVRQEPPHHRRTHLPHPDEADALRHPRFSGIRSGQGQRRRARDDRDVDRVGARNSARE